MDWTKFKTHPRGVLHIPCCDQLRTDTMMPVLEFERPPPPPPPAKLLIRHMPDALQGLRFWYSCGWSQVLADSYSTQRTCIRFIADDSVHMSQCTRLSALGHMLQTTAVKEEEEEESYKLHTAWHAGFSDGVTADLRFICASGSNYHLASQQLSPVAD